MFDASVSIVKSLLKSGIHNTGAVQSAFFSASNANCYYDYQTNGVFLPVNADKGAANYANFLTNLW